VTSSSTPEERLRELGLELPPPPPAVGNYLGLVRAGDLLFVSGHGPFKDGELIFRGKLGLDFDVEQGKQAAHLVALNMLGTIKAEIGELDQLKRLIKLLVLVNSTPEFTEQHLVANGASNLFVEVFGEDRGRHARSAVGMATLPFGIAVEIEGIFSLE
jgi:enamine deaminase RidA (YjgF/YER057c/UK114 family)